MVINVLKPRGNSVKRQGQPWLQARTVVRLPGFKCGRVTGPGTCDLRPVSQIWDSVSSPLQWGYELPSGHRGDCGNKMKKSGEVEECGVWHRRCWINRTIERMIYRPEMLMETWVSCDAWSLNTSPVFLSLCLPTGFKSLLRISTLQRLFMVQRRLQGIRSGHHPYVHHFHIVDCLWPQTGEFPY